MNTSKVIPKVGQVWVSKLGIATRIGSMSMDDINWVEGGFDRIKDLHKHYTFKPDNDLEWLSVNRSIWLWPECPMVSLLRGDTPNYCNDGDYTRKQWQDKRNELFGIDEKWAVEGTKNFTDTTGGRLTYIGDKLSSDNIKELADELAENDKPVYTKAMAYAKLLPKAGSNFMVFDMQSRDYVEARMLMLHKESMVVEIDGWDSAIVFSSDVKIKPVDARIGEEKLVNRVNMITNYVKCGNCIFDLKEDYCIGRLYFNEGSNKAPKYQIVVGVAELVHHLLYDNVYRRVERPMTWQEALADSFPVHVDGVIIELTATEFHQETFIEMCHLVASMTDK